jgi:hypothetical protein
MARSIPGIIAIAAVLAAHSAWADEAGASGDTFNVNTDQPAASGNHGPGDPLNCFDRALRGAKAAVQAYQLVFAPGWEAETQCRGQASGDSDLEGCWGTLSQARGLIEQAAPLFETGRKSPEPESHELIDQANALIKQAAGLADQAAECFKPVYAKWHNPGAPLQGRAEATAPPGQPANPSSGGPSGQPQTPQGPNGAPPGQSGNPNPAAPGTPGQPPGQAAGPNPATPQAPGIGYPPVVLAAKAAADAIAEGTGGPDVLGPLNKAQHDLPPDVARPIDCWSMMVDAQSKRPVDPAESAKKAQQAVDCYERNAPPLLLKGRVAKNEGQPDCGPPPDVQEQLMESAAALDRIVTQWQNKALEASDQFYLGATEVVSGELKNLQFVASHPDLAAAKIAQGVITYLTNDHNENDQKLYEAAAQFVDEFQKNPARTLGRTGATLAVNEATAGAGKVVSGGLKACAAPIRQAQRIKAAQKAAKVLEDMNERENKFAGFVADASEAEPQAASRAPKPPPEGPSTVGPQADAPSPPAKGPSQGGWGSNPPRAPNEANAGTGPSTLDPILCEGFGNVCVKTALAQAETWATGRPQPVRPHYPEYLRNIEDLQAPMDTARLEKTLREGYGHKHFGDLPEWRMQEQHAGRPSWATRSQIIQELENAPEGAQGVIFVQQAAGQTGHVVNGGKINGQVILKDAGGGFEGTPDLPHNLSRGGMNPEMMIEGDPYRIYWYRLY